MVMEKAPIKNLYSVQVTLQPTRVSDTTLSLDPIPLETTDKTLPGIEAGESWTVATDDPEQEIAQKIAEESGSPIPGVTDWLNSIIGTTGDTGPTGPTASFEPETCLIYTPSIAPENPAANLIVGTLTCGMCDGRPIYRYVQEGRMTATPGELHTVTMYMADELEDLIECGGYYECGNDADNNRVKISISCSSKPPNKACMYYDTPSETAPENKVTLETVNTLNRDNNLYRIWFEYTLTTDPPIYD